MNYQVQDEVIFYRSNSEKALEVERIGTIGKVNKKTIWINCLEDNIRSGIDWNGRMPKYWKGYNIKKELVKEVAKSNNIQ